ncbi:hypothetical protein VNI00_017755 [Paramarasmius palmivorus]|uniref:Uncharacterized protein n=1 Tax=Paramarasmius palmivorus TaxID=297713 RepID=A0AAW0B3G8_9AGAR
MSTSFQRRNAMPRITGHKGMDYLLSQCYKAALYFPTDDEPRIVRLERRKINGYDFCPYLDPDDQEGGTALIKAIHAEGDQGFRLFYFEQTSRNSFAVNDCVTRELQAFTDGLSRPWLGPILVIWDDEDIITKENLEEKGEEILTQVHNFYEEFVRDDAVPFDTVESESDEPGRNGAV